MRKPAYLMNDLEKERYKEVHGTTLLMLEEMYSTWQIAKAINLHPWQVEANIDEMLYILRKRVGLKRFLKTIFVK